MKILKNTVVFMLSICLLVSFVGCGEKDAYDSFEPAGVYVVETIENAQFETDIDNKEIAQKMWDAFNNLYIDTDQRGEMGSSYVYMCFYDEDESTLAIFTIYDNGSCCLGEEFTNFYVVQDGQKAYMEFCDLYTDYSE